MSHISGLFVQNMLFHNLRSLPPTKTQLKEVSIEATRITALPYFIFCPRLVFLVTLAQFNEAAVGYAISLNA